mgnify:CR=1 FL=1
MQTHHDINQVAAAIDFLGGDTAVAHLAGLKTAWAVSKWRKRLPAERVLWLAQQTGWKWSPHTLAPKLYPNPTDGLPLGGETLSQVSPSIFSEPNIGK